MKIFGPGKVQSIDSILDVVESIGGDIGRVMGQKGAIGDSGCLVHISVGAVLGFDKQLAHAYSSCVSQEVVGQTLGEELWELD